MDRSVSQQLIKRGNINVTIVLRLLLVGVSFSINEVPHKIFYDIK
jgi:hypothetical protein